MEGRLRGEGRAGSGSWRSEGGSPSPRSSSLGRRRGSEGGPPSPRPSPQERGRRSGCCFFQTSAKPRAAFGRSGMSTRRGGCASQGGVALPPSLREDASYGEAGRLPAHSKRFASSRAGPHGAKRLECVELARAFVRPSRPESASKLDALHTLRDPPATRIGVPCLRGYGPFFRGR